MTRLLFASAVILAVCPSSVLAQEKKMSCNALPPAVRAAFEKAFAKATINDCVRDVEKGKTTFEITSTEGETRRHVRFHPDGKVMEVEEPVAIGSVPEPAKQAVSKKYPKGEITLVEKVTRDDQVLYEFRVKQGKKSLQIAFDSDGKEVKSKAK
jgi:Putative beta-lactamase-inhibitor-like, PepSY-like